MARYSVKTFGFRGSWGQIQRIEEGFARIGCHVAAEGEDFDFIYRTSCCKAATRSAARPRAASR